MTTYNTQKPNNRARFADRGEQQDIIECLDALFFSFDNVKKEDANRALKYHFPNGVRWSVRSHHKYVILGLCQGAKLIADEPLLGGLFDAQGKIIAKIYLSTPEQIEQKAIQALIEKTYQLPIDY